MPRGAFTFTYRIDWRRGPSHLRAAMREVRIRFLEDLADRIRRNAPHPHVAASVRQSPAEVVIAHPAAAIFEFGAPPHFPPLEPIREWALSVGKDPDSAYPIARSIAGRGLGGQRGSRGGHFAVPYIIPAIDAAISQVPKWATEIWEGGRGSISRREG